MKARKQWIALCLAAMMALTACGGSTASTADAPADGTADAAATDTDSATGEDSGEKITLSVIHYFTKEEAEAGDATRQIPRAVIDAFNEQYGDEIELVVTELQHDDYETKVQALAAANDMPDIYLSKGSWVSNFVESGLMLDISDALAACEWYDDYRDPDVLFLPVTYEGGIYGTPIQHSSTSIVFYNRELWAAAGYDSFPTTWDEVFAAKAAFDDMGVDTIAFGNTDKWNYNSSWISTIGDRFTGSDWTESIIAKDGTASFTDQEFVDALALTVEIGQSGILNPDYASIGNQQALSQFIQGKAATTIDGYWAIEYMNANMDDDFAQNIGIAPLPGIAGGKGDQSAITSGCGWFFSVNGNLEGAKKEAAELFVLFNTGAELSDRYAEAGIIGPTLAEADTSNIPVLNQEYLQFIDNATSSVHIYDALIDASVIDVMNNQFPDLLAGVTTPEAAAEAIQAEYESTLG